MLAGRTRVTTLKRYVTVFQQWRLWLLESKQIVPPGRPSDLVDYLLARRDEPCGRSIPELIMKAICWMEKVAEFAPEQRATQGRLAWAIKDRIVESLFTGAPLTKRAPRFPVAVLARFEELVLDDMYAIGWRIWAWIKLVKVWASLRWSDIQAILPQELHLIEGRLSTILRRTKTSGPNRQVKELPVCVSEKAYFAKPEWVKVGFDLLQLHVRYKRDYLVPRLKGMGLWITGGELRGCYGSYCRAIECYPAATSDAGLLDGTLRESGDSHGLVSARGTAFGQGYFG